MKLLPPGSQGCDLHLDEKFRNPCHTTTTGPPAEIAAIGLIALW
jgi:hypothetical protein